MRGINKVILIGNLGRDPEFKQAATAICNLALATSETYKDKNGVRQDKTEWHKITAFGKLAEICNQYLKKGSKVYIEGKLTTQKYQKDGQDVYTTKIIAENLQMLDSKSDSAPKVVSQADKDAELFDTDVPF